MRKAYEFGKRFAEEGNIIVSGLALGCDKAAHDGCLDAGGKTIAIVASGFNIIHPKENSSLQQLILDNGGLVLSEHPLGIKANPSRLIARTRLQAALSEAVILSNVLNIVAVCTLCVLPVSIINNALLLFIQDILRSMQVMNYY